MFKKEILKNGDVVIEYYLQAMPSVQHKAGLSGMYEMIKYMNEKEIDDSPIIEEITPNKLRIRINKKSFTNLMNIFYDSVYEEKEYNKKWANKEPKKIINRDDKEYYIYDSCVPSLKIFSDYLGYNQRMVNLFRKFITKIKYDKIKPFNERASGNDIGFCKSWEKIASIKHKITKSKNSVDSNLFMGAKSKEKTVTYNGEILTGHFEEIMLLHFSTIVTMIFIPQEIKYDNKTKKHKRTQKGFIWVVPNICDLEEFSRDFKEFSNNFCSDNKNEIDDKNEEWQYPRQCLIGYPLEAGLKFCYEISQKKVAKEMKYSIIGTESYHVDKTGKARSSFGNFNFSVDQNILEEYKNIEEFDSILFRNIYLINIINNKKWYCNMNKIFNDIPFNDSGYDSNCIEKDIKEKFKQIKNNYQVDKNKGDAMGNINIDKPVEIIIKKIVQRYIWKRAEKLSGISYDSFKDNKKDGKISYPEPYLEKVKKVADKTYYEIRNRHGQSFKNYFSSMVGEIDYASNEEWETIIKMFKDKKSTDDMKNIVILSIRTCS